MKTKKIGTSQKNTDFTSRFKDAAIRLFEMLKNERGQGLVEYALIIGIVSLVCIASISALGGNVYDAFFVKIQGWLTSTTR
ncbi:MAG TPA: Flp family type IVb pilin [Candidatus Wallbacteria bacterium]|nr:Flp family type IVb pilin [Candidatus Wallbacteria bacterium]